MDNQSSGFRAYIESVAKESDAIEFFIDGRSLVVEGVYFDSDYPGMILGADINGAEVTICVERIAATRTYERPSG